MNIRKTLIAAVGVTAMFGGLSTAFADTTTMTPSVAPRAIAGAPAKATADHKRLAERRHLRHERRLAMKRHGAKTSKLALRKTETNGAKPVAKAG